MEYLYRIPDKTQSRNAINHIKIIVTLFVYLKRTFLFHIRK